MVQFVSIPAVQVYEHVRGLSVHEAMTSRYGGVIMLSPDGQ